eukprot:3787209-Prymnesium_polylepis.1
MYMLTPLSRPSASCSCTYASTKLRISRSLGDMRLRIVRGSSAPCAALRSDGDIVGHSCSGPPSIPDIVGKPTIGSAGTPLEAEHEGGRARGTGRCGRSANEASDSNIDSAAYNY